MSESTHSRIADEALAAELAQAAGAILLGIRAEGLGVDGGRELGRRGDKAADSYILDRLAAERPGDTVSDTHNWPYEPQLGNRPTGESVIWTGGFFVICFTADHLLR